MIASYCCASVLIFVVGTSDAEPGVRISEAVFLILPLSLMSFWLSVFPVAIVWLLFRQRLSYALVMTVLVGVFWSLVTGYLSPFEVKPGYFGRAIEDGRPTIHHFVDTFMDIGMTIGIYEALTKLFWGARRGRKA